LPGVGILPQGQVRALSTGQAPQAPAWHTLSQWWRPQASCLPQTRWHWKLRRPQGRRSSSAPQAHLLARGGGGGGGRAVGWRAGGEAGGPEPSTTPPCPPHAEGARRLLQLAATQPTACCNPPLTTHTRPHPTHTPVQPHDWAGRAGTVVARLAARMPTLQPPAAGAPAAELGAAAALLQALLAAEAARVHHQGAGRAGPRVAQQHAGVRAAAGKLLAAQLAARVRHVPGVEGRLLLLRRRSSKAGVARSAQAPAAAAPVAAPSATDAVLLASSHPTAAADKGIRPVRASATNVPTTAPRLAATRLTLPQKQE